MQHEFRKTKNEFLQEIIRDYLVSHPEVVDWRMKDVAAWAIREDRWQMPARSAINICAAELSNAARAEHYMDPQGRRVRTKHCRRETTVIDGKRQQMVLWEDITNATPQHMQVSLQQRRLGVVDVAFQLKQDADSYNENNIHGGEVQLTFDLTEDLLDREAPPGDPDGADGEPVA